MRKQLRFGLGPVVRRRRDLRPGIPYGGGRSGDRSFETRLQAVVEAYQLLRHAKSFA